MASQEESGRRRRSPGGPAAWWAAVLLAEPCPRPARSPSARVASPTQYAMPVEDRATEATDFFRAFGRDEETEVDLAVETPDRDEPSRRCPGDG